MRLNLTIRRCRHASCPAASIPYRPEAEVVQGYVSAVRSALTDDGRPPLEASGLKLQERLAAIDTSLQRAVKKKGGCRRN